MADRVISRRSLLAVAAGGAAAAAATPWGPALAATAGGRSGLPWASGMCGPGITGRAAATDIDAQEAFRGRGLDVQATFANWRKGWKGWVDAPFWRAGLPEVLAERGIRVAHATPLLCAGSEGMFAECAAGEFDRYHRDVARRWRDLGHPAPVIRLGWEATDDSNPWNARQDTTPGRRAYKEAFRRIAEVYRRELPGCELEWNNLRRPGGDVREFYPGDDWVDIVAADIYANEPGLQEDEDWEKFANGLDRSGGPGGLLSHARFAEQRGKRFAVAEWGVTNLERTPEGAYDSGRFVRGMWEFFSRHAGKLAYECYFNRNGGKGDHRIHPPEYNPRASAAYAGLWRP
jgi:hypothetical protein